jgi:DNA end-binding protein Ku
VEATFEQREIDMAKLLIDSMTTAWEPAAYRDTYRERVEELIDQKRHGTLVVSEGPRAEPAPVVDLLAALQASVSAARGRAGAPAAGKPANAGRGDASARETDDGEGEARPRKQAGGRSAAKSVRAAKPAGHREAAAEPAPAPTRSELLRQATELAITGRSKMTREELEQAVADASRGRRRKAS